MPTNVSKFFGKIPGFQQPDFKRKCRRDQCAEFGKDSPDPVRAGFGIALNPPQVFLIPAIPDIDIIAEFVQL